MEFFVKFLQSREDQTKPAVAGNGIWNYYTFPQLCTTTLHHDIAPKLCATQDHTLQTRSKLHMCRTFNIARHLFFRLHTIEHACNVLFIFALLSPFMFCKFFALGNVLQCFSMFKIKFALCNVSHFIGLQCFVLGNVLHYVGLQ